MSDGAVLYRCAPTALSTMRTQNVRSACASSKAYPESAVISAVLSTLSLGLDALRRRSSLENFGRPVSRPAWASRSR